MSYVLFESDRKNKKWTIITPNMKTIHFGQLGAEDYTQHNDEKRRRLYIARHKPREDWNNPNTAGFWSRFLLWEKPSIHQALYYIRNTLGVDVRLI
jgi:hypothetical protein